MLDVTFNREVHGQRFSDHSMETIKQVVETIAYLHDDLGMTYADIDALLQLGRKAKYIMNGARAKFLRDCGLVN